VCVSLSLSSLYAVGKLGGRRQSSLSFAHNLAKVQFWLGWPPGLEKRRKLNTHFILLMGNHTHHALELIDLDLPDKDVTNGENSLVFSTFDEQLNHPINQYETYSSMRHLTQEPIQIHFRRGGPMSGCASSYNFAHLSLLKARNGRVEARWAGQTRRRR